MLRLALLALVLEVLMTSATSAQTNACTMVANGASQDINVFSDCKKVTNNAGATVCAISNVTAAQWQSFYNNPPAGVTVSACGAPPDCTANYVGVGNCNSWSYDTCGYGMDSSCATASMTAS